MPRLRPCIVQEGDYPAKIAAEHGCREDEIKRQPAERDDDDVRPRADGLRPGDIVLVPDRPRAREDLSLREENAHVRTRVGREVEIYLKHGAHKDAPIGTKYRLTIGTRPPTEGAITQPGRIAKETLDSNERVVLEWAEHPAIHYVAPPTLGGPGGQDEIAPSRAGVLTPMSVPEIVEETQTDLDPESVGQEDCRDRFRNDSVASEDTTHTHHHLAKKVKDLIAKNTGNAVASGSTAPPWDTRWFASHPLLPHFYPIPARAPDGPRAYFHKQTLKIEPAPGDANKGVATAREDRWYDARTADVKLFGLDKVVSRREIKGLSRGSNEDWLELATAFNKRLVKLWMGELKTLVPASEHAWLKDWFASGEGRDHFTKWCQVVHLATEKGGEGHKNGCAIDVDYTFNPWAPLYTQEHAQMLGEIKRDKKTREVIDTTQLYIDCGAAYDRALRLFVGPKPGATPEAHARDLATAYYRNHWDWVPDRLHVICRNYQALSWSLIAYFDYLCDRAKVPKTPQANPSCQTLQRRKPEDVWRLLKQDFDGGFLHPEATLVLSVNPLGVKDLFAESASFRYPYGPPVRVWVARLSDLSAQAAGKEKALGACLLNQIVQDHSAVSGSTERDACRGAYNLSYDVAMAFGRMLSNARDLNRMRMFSFGMGTGANGGDFMHIEYLEGTRATAYIELKVEGRAPRPAEPWRARVGATAALTVRYQKANSTDFRGEDITDANDLDVVTSKIEVCDFRRESGKYTLVAAGPGKCLLTATYQGMKAAVAVVIEAGSSPL